MRTCPTSKTSVTGRLPGLALAIAGALLFSASVQAQNIAGAIFTTTANGTVVNGNLYDSKLDVYLNGGPQNCSAPGLPVGTYYYMVTNPSGSVRLSHDAVSSRKFRVSQASNGRISMSYDTANHPNGTSLGPCGSKTVRLAKNISDYADTDNHGGVYKVWITRVADFDALYSVGCGAADCELQAFVHSNTKTDNFKAAEGENPPPPPEELTGTMEAFKYYDANVNGTYDAGDTPLANWPMTLSPELGVTPALQLTSGSGFAMWFELPEDFYTVTEGEPTQSGWWNSAPSGGTPLDGDTVLTPVSASGAVSGGSTTSVSFGNFCIAASGGHTLGFWSNKNGQQVINDNGSAAPELALLTSYHLRTATGGNFDPTTYSALKTWLLNGTATNMSYMLSVQLAAMILNIEAGFVNGNAMYVPYGGTINQLVAEADAALAANGYTPSGSADRANQEVLKNYIDALNNGAGVVPTSPCAYSF
ncbi:MAG: hypothetical protein ABIP44_01360 [Pseudoxanthomonas sp.]